MYDLFISYSRKNGDFVRPLYDALITHELKVWVDWLKIPPTTDWWETIKDGIDKANAVAFIVSPDSMSSPVCQLEINYAIENNKRLIPIILKSVDNTTIFEALALQIEAQGIENLLSTEGILDSGRNNWTVIARRNWVFFKDGMVHDENVSHLVTAIQTDYALVEAHTELLVRAKAWNERGRVKGLLMRGLELTEAKKWLEHVSGLPSGDKNDLISPTSLHIDYITESLRINKRRNRTNTAIAFVLPVVGIVIGAAILWQIVQILSRPQPMSGDFNVGIVPVYEVAKGDISITRDTEVLTEKIMVEIDANRETFREETGIDMQVQQLTDIPVTTLKDAETLFADYNAHVLVYGIFDDDERTFTPRFHITSRLAGVSEITGDSSFGSPIENFPVQINNNLMAEPILQREGFTGRIKMLAQFLFGIAAFNETYYDISANYFADLHYETDWERDDGKEILYLWIGTTAYHASADNTLLDCPSGITAQNADDLILTSIPLLDCALSSYQLALEANEQFDRARLGIANVYSTWAQSFTTPICSLFVDYAVPQLEAVLQYNDEIPRATLTNLKALYSIGTNYRDYADCTLGDDDTVWQQAAISAFDDAFTVGSQLDKTDEVNEIMGRALYQKGLVLSNMGAINDALSTFKDVITLTDPILADFSREPQWKTIRFFSHIRRAHLLMHQAMSANNDDLWQQVLHETDAVVNVIQSKDFDNPQFVFNTWHYRGVALDALGRQTESCEILNNAIQIAEDHPNEFDADAIYASPLIQNC